VLSFFSSSLEHLQAELTRLHILVQLQVNRARSFQGGERELRGLVIQEQEVDMLLSVPFGLPDWVAERKSATHDRKKLSQLKARADRKKRESLARSIRLRLEELRVLFDLDEFDMDVLLVCLGPELIPPKSS
jgi:hypothetical protein